MSRKIMSLVAALVLVSAAFFLFRDELSREWAKTRAPETTVAKDPAEAPRDAGTDDLVPLETAAPRNPAPADPTTPEAPAPAPVTLPPLPESDPFVRERAESLGIPSAWVAGQDLVRRFAVGIDNATRGDLPRRTLRLPKPEIPFAVIEREGRLFPDPRNALRYDPYLDRLEAIPPDSAARFLETIEPLVEAAFEELGSPQRAREVLLEAIEGVVDTPRRPGTDELVRSKGRYEYVDPDLETLPPLEKQLLRMGPRNLGRLQRYLSSLADILGATRSAIGDSRGRDQA